jgi:glycosyltransferase involved in cell wall biosynthesis
MSICLALAIACFIFALIPAIVFAGNLPDFTPPRRAKNADVPPPPVSVLIPARNEARSIALAIQSVLAARGIDFELIVLDDHSSDDTAAIVSSIAQRDSRVRLISAPPLPPGWCGKQHACQVLADHASYDTLMWMDADVQLSPDAVANMAAELSQTPASLISGFPFERTETWLEAMLIPLIHFILLAFLPLRQMRRSVSPSLGAGCGQLFMARRADYFAGGGHAAIRSSLHDGIALPRAFRRAGKRTDLFDASKLAQCRMYASAGAVWNGLLKNAGEGVASPAGILPWTVLLFGGQVMPAILIVYLASNDRAWSLPMLLAATAFAMGVLVRTISAKRFYSRSAGFAKYLSALAHSAGILVFLLIQWQSLLRRLTGRRSNWKGRSY